jgi:hypothetical protein
MNGRLHERRFRHDDAVLMEYLMKYCPDDPHVENYPGSDA